MADRTMQTGDTWPPLKGLAADEDGPVDLSLADSLRVVLKAGSTIVTGTAEVIEPPEVDGEETYNWQYIWEDGDTDLFGIYRVQLVVTWSPTEIERFPNSGGPTVTIEQAND